eukprot:scaffold374_cov282-Alexandrium_tamarense.AAC.1
MELSDGKSIGLTDPLRIAERIIALRSEIAQEWRVMMVEVKDDHLALNDILFRVLMGKAIDESGNEIDDMVRIEEERTVEPLSDSAGAFE